MAFSLGEYQDIFLEEADEQLQELNQNLLELEKNPENIDIINNIFRAAHSLKSSAAFVGLNDLSDLAHKMENLLQGIRDQTLAITPEIVNVIFKCFDEISSVIDTVSSGEAPHQDLSAIIKRIQEVSDNAKPGSPQQKKADENQSTKSDLKPAAKEGHRFEFTAQETKLIGESLQNGEKCYQLDVYIEKNAQMKWIKAQLVSTNLERLGNVLKINPAIDEFGDDKESFSAVVITSSAFDELRKACDIDLIASVDVKEFVLEIKDDRKLIKFGESRSFIISTQEAPVLKDEKKQAVKEEAKDEPSDDSDDDETDIKDINFAKKDSEHSDHEKKKGAALKTVKVSVDKLDLLLNNVGELVISNSGFYKLYEELRRLGGDKKIVNEFKNRMEQMSRIAKDLQTGIMKTRMVPIGQVFSRFNRLVRDLTKEFKKNVELVIKGEDTELDKKVIDAIGEPLLHLIRNAIDHGIETSDDRKKLGKSENAIVTLNAFQGGNQIFVTVSDDGRGLNSELIKKKIIEKNLATFEQLSNMDNQDIYNYIFIPGFSTASRVTDISGRGVGMNVVKEIVSELNGTVSIETESGMGTRFIMAFPLTLAIIPAIMVRVRREIYAIPLSDVIETIKISQSDITTIEGHEVINLRGEILSLLRLNQFIGARSALAVNAKIPVVVVGFGNRKIGLIVDFLEGKQEIVIKSLEQNYTTVEGLAGASILGDGSICLILDIASMINKVITEQDRLSRGDRKKMNEIEEAYYEDEVIEDYENIEDAYKMNVGDSMLFSDHDDKKETLKEEKKTVMPVQEQPGSQFTAEKKSATVTMFDDLKPEEKKDDPLSDELINDKVSKALKEFKDELKDNIKNTLAGSGHDSHLGTALNISKEDLTQFQLMANIGAANAAESLSKILSKRIDLSIPEVSIKPIETIPAIVGDIGTPYIGVMLQIEGEARGTVLFTLGDTVGIDLINLLYGTTIRSVEEIGEDGESALKEITNIIGASVINVFSEKSGLMIKPSIPTFVHDYMQSIIDSILVLHTMKNDYAIVMDTVFYFEDDKVIGNLLIMPEADSLIKIVGSLKSNV